MSRSFAFSNSACAIALCLGAAFALPTAALANAPAKAAGKTDGKTDGKTTGKTDGKTAAKPTPAKVAGAPLHLHKSAKAAKAAPAAASTDAAVPAPAKASAATKVSAPSRAAAAERANREQLTALIERHAGAHGVPSALAHRVVMRESRYNPAARNRAYWGLMQIRHDTARGMGYVGPAEGLLDPDVNLRYGMAYLGNAYRVAGGDQSRAVALYASGFYYEAKRKGMLGQIRKAVSAPASAPISVTVLEANAR